MTDAYQRIAEFQTLPLQFGGLVVDLPFPPSTNKLWRLVSGGRVALSTEYKHWKAQADRLFLTQIRLLKVAGAKWPVREYVIHMVFDRACSSRVDSDNLMKAVNDWLQRAEIIENDRYCAGGSWRWGTVDDAPHGCRVIVEALDGLVPPT